MADATASHRLIREQLAATAFGDERADRVFTLAFSGHEHHYSGPEVLRVLRARGFVVSVTADGTIELRIRPSTAQ